MCVHPRSGWSSPRVLVERVLPPNASSAAVARAMLRSAVPAELGTEVVDTAELLTSELVTNVIVHAGTSCRLRVSEPTPGVLGVEVHDDAPVGRALTPSTPTVTGDDGRGLLLVDALAAAWGTTDEPRGKTVWFEVGV